MGLAHTRSQWGKSVYGVKLEYGKGQVILNEIFLFSFEPKTQRNYFLISGLASKMGRIKKMKTLYYINYRPCDFLDALDFDSF